MKAQRKKIKASVIGLGKPKCPIKHMASSFSHNQGYFAEPTL